MTLIAIMVVTMMMITIMLMLKHGDDGSDDES